MKEYESDPTSGDYYSTGTASIFSSGKAHGDGYTTDNTSISSSSTFDDGFVTDTTSIASTIYRHRHENGRTYHKFREGEYWGPNDEQQNDQLDIA